MTILVQYRCFNPGFQSLQIGKSQEYCVCVFLFKNYLERYCNRPSYVCQRVFVDGSIISDGGVLNLSRGVRTGL